jgi:hypothetical protein
VAALVACDRRPSGNRTDDAAPLTTLERVDAAIARGGAFLRGRQSADGGFRTSPYPAFRDGLSLGPLALAALRFAPGGDESYRRGVSALAVMLDAATAPGAAAPTYPQYAFGLGAIVLNAPGNEAHRGSRDAALTALRARQLPGGGWAYPPMTVAAPAANLPATLVAIGALRLAGVPASDPALAAAGSFVERCQNLGPPGCTGAGCGDGGFFFSPDDRDANKAGADGDHLRSYGSMTADGLRALVRLDLPPAAPRVAAAARWLERHFDAAQNPGDFAPADEVRRASAYYYWTWTAAHAYRAIGKVELITDRGHVRWAEALAAALLARQGADGSWRNPATEMREDDPVVATSFAVAALAVSRSVIAGEYRSHQSSPPSSVPRP